MVLHEGITAKGKITSKGQVTIPRAMRDRLRIRPGDTVEFVADREGVHVRKAFDAKAFDAAIEKWSGYIKDLDGMTVDEYIREMRGE